MTQNVRISQFTITYGPGAILEGSRGPRVIPQPDIGLFGHGSGLGPADYVISDQRMSQGLLRGAQIFRLPSNAELGLPDTQYIYHTYPFPGWSLCLNSRAHGSNSSILYLGRGCPVCNISGTRSQEAIRFVRACPGGHMDDVDWYHLIHRSFSGCRHRRWFNLYGGGGALSQIEVECPRCGQRVNLGWAYGQQWRCSGRFPERELPGTPNRPGCGLNARIIQRQASNLRIPELRTLFTIPPRCTRLHNLLQVPSIFSVLVASGESIKSRVHLDQMLRNLESRGLITQDTMNEIFEHPWDAIRQAIRDILSPVSTSYRSLIHEEFNALIEASVNGAPPVRGPSPSSSYIFEVNPNLVQTFAGASGRRFRVVPILRLRTVTVQTGYRREIDTQAPANLVDVSFADSINLKQRWYPGVEFPGEGVFIMLEDDGGWHYEIRGSAVEEWGAAFNDPSIYSSDYVFRSSQREELHPVFVWWHTLAHLLIRAVSIEAGYSSASIRERIYLEVDGLRARGGILLYATQPGSEGTMGGLIALAPYFCDVLSMAFDMLRFCSGDPLCIENGFNAGQYNGAACYGCLLISETSCEHRNMWLDRNVLLGGNLP